MLAKPSRQRMRCNKNRMKNGGLSQDQVYRSSDQPWDVCFRAAPQIPFIIPSYPRHVPVHAAPLLMLASCHKAPIMHRPNRPHISPLALAHSLSNMSRDFVLCPTITDKMMLLSAIVPWMILLRPCLAQPDLMIRLPDCAVCLPSHFTDMDED